MCMEFGVPKCAMLITARGKLARRNGIRQRNNTWMKSLSKDDCYKYLREMESG